MILASTTGSDRGGTDNCLREVAIVRPPAIDQLDRFATVSTGVEVVPSTRRTPALLVGNAFELMKSADCAHLADPRVHIELRVKNGPTLSNAHRHRT